MARTASPALPETLTAVDADGEDFALDFGMTDTAHMTRAARGLPTRERDIDPVAAKLDAERRAAPHIAEAIAAKSEPVSVRGRFVPWHTP